MTQVKSSPVVDRVAFEKLRRVAPSALIARRARQVVRPLPDEVSFKLTNRCNLRCHHCYEWSEDGYHRTFEAEERNRDLDISVVAKTLDATRENGANVFLWGGEPLFYSHWDDLVELLAEHRRWTSVCTNGVYIEKRLDSLLTISDRLEMFIALDGFEAEHDALRGALSWRRTMKGSAAWSMSGVPGTIAGRLPSTVSSRTRWWASCSTSSRSCKTKPLTRSTSATRGTSLDAPPR